MTTYPIDLEQARDLLLQAMRTQGRDFVYNPGGKGTCMYSPWKYDLKDEGSPRSRTGCLIGVALSLAGERRHLNYGGGIHALSRVFPEMMTSETVEYFSWAQALQDMGHSWGTAYNHAEKYVERLEYAKQGAL